MNNSIICIYLITKATKYFGIQIISPQRGSLICLLLRIVTNWISVILYAYPCTSHPIQKLHGDRARLFCVYIVYTSLLT